MTPETNENGAQSNPVRSVPVSDWKRNFERLKVGHHIRNNRGQLGVVTWLSNRCCMYRLGTRELNGNRQTTRGGGK